MTTRRAILSIDEGTTGTRAAWVDEHGQVGGLHYEKLTVSAPRHGVVEQDATEILTKTITAVRQTLADAHSQGVAIVSMAIATQRATFLLWDTVTGLPLGPAVVWQDTRYADELAVLGQRWNQNLLSRVGRGTGVRSPYLTAARQLADNPAAQLAQREGRLAFGTIDTWLIWNIVQGRPHLTTATNATSCGAYELRDHSYALDYIESLAFPTDLLPALADDGRFFGITDPEVVGIAVPLRAVIGDLHAGMIGLGALHPGDAMCVHGTGSFVDLNLGQVAPENVGRYDGALSLVAWRAAGSSRYSIETFTATTGSALDWICDTLGWFDDTRALSTMAAAATSPGGVQFIPAMTGVRMPVVDPDVTCSLSGIDFSTTREQVALGVLEGIAQSVAWNLLADSEVAGISVAGVTVGGGLAHSDPLLQLQADLTQVPQRRLQGTEYASIRGAAFLAGVGEIWDDLDDAARLLASEAVFEPAITADECESRVAAWRARVDLEIELNQQHKKTEV